MRDGCLRMMRRDESAGGVVHFAGAILVFTTWANLAQEHVRLLSYYYSGYTLRS